MILFKYFTFDSAHYLPKVPDGHKCKALHGHTYRLTLYIEGEVDEDTGWVMDFGELKKIALSIVRSLDHKLLNDIPGLENPTCENIARWIWGKLKPDLPLLSKIKLYETPTSGVVYQGE